jgi:glycosyltransferase involved in cell wall biosynthesis
VNILLTNATDIYSGGEEYVLILARHLRLRGHTVAVSALPGHLLLEKCSQEQIPAIPINYRGMGRVFTVAHELRGHLRARRIEVVHSNANYDRTVAAMAAAFTPIRHVAGIHSAHSIQFNITHWLRNKWGIDRFITDADAGRDVLVDTNHIPGWKVTTVPIGFEETDKAKAARVRPVTRAALGATDRTVIIGNVARLVPFKGHRYLLEAIALVRKEIRDILFPIVGDGELEADLRAQAKQLGIEDVVRFLGFRDDLDDLYPAFDIYCHSSLELASEMFPLAVIRALSAGLPVVSTRVGGIPAMVLEGSSGHLVPPADPAAFAAALLLVIRDEGRRAAMGAASLALFHQKYHVTAMAEKIESVYREVLA